MSKTVKCINCHFLSGIESGEVSHSILAKTKRVLLKKKSKIVIDNNLVSVVCHHGFWDSDYDYEKCFYEAFKDRLLDDCLFWPYKEDLSIQGAEVLQKRSEDRKAFKTTMFYSRLAILLAAIALFFNLISLLKN